MPMLAHQATERLIIVGKFASGILCRLHSLMNYQKPEIITEKDVETYCKKLVKFFPALPENMDQKERGAEQFSKHATNISTHLFDYYNTFRDLLNFREEAMTLLMDMNTTMHPFSFKLYPDVMRLYMDLFVNYVKIHLLMSRIENRRLFVCCYAKAIHCTSGNTEPDYPKIAEIMHLFVKPAQPLWAELEPFAQRMSETLIELMVPLLSWGNVGAFHTKKVFNLLEDPKGMTLPKGETDHIQIMSLESFKTWIMWGYFACPAAINSEGAVSLLSECLKEHFCLPIFRDECLNIHEEFNTIFSSYVPPNKTKTTFKISKHKKKFKESYADPMQTIKAHEEMRTYLRCEMTTMVQIFEEFPQITAPKMQMILAAMTLAEREVLWYFTNRRSDVAPFKSSKKFVFPFDAWVPQLIDLSLRLRDVVEQHAGLIQNYYLKYLRGADKEEAQPLVKTFLETAKASPLVNEIMQSVMDKICSTTDTNVNFDVVRLNWYRVCGAIFSTTSNVLQAPCVKLAPVINKMIMHSRLVDLVGSQLDQAASFSMLYWYRKDMMEIIKDSQALFEGQQRHLMALVRVLNAGLLNVHSLCPEEQPRIGKESTIVAESMLRFIVLSAESHLKYLIAKTQQLRSQVGTDKVIQRMKEGTAKEGQGQGLPGSESKWERQSSIQSIRQWKRAISDVCQAISSTDTLRVYNVEFVPREYLYASMAANIRNTLRGMVMSKNKNSIERPSTILSRFRDVMYAYQTVEQHLNINMSDIFRDVLLSEMTDEGGEMAGEAFHPEDALPKNLHTRTHTNLHTRTKTAYDLEAEKSNKTRGIVHRISAWYACVFRTDLVTLGISYSPTLQAFASNRKASSARGSTHSAGQDLDIHHIDAEKYTNPSDLRALATLLGPSGVRCMEKHLLKVVTDNTAKIKAIVQENQTVVAGLTHRFTEQPAWKESKERLCKMDELVVCARIMGCCLTFRTLLRAALKAVVEDRVPFIFKAVQHAHDQVHTHVRCDQEMADLDYLASDCGLSNGEADHMLRAALQRFKTTQTDLALWNLLPEVFGMALCSNQFMKSKYSVINAGHHNNVHCIVETIKALVVNLARLPIPGQLNVDPDERIQSAYERFVKCGSYSLLHMHATLGDLECLAHEMVFLEQFINGSDGRLSLSLLEQCYPYTLLRSNYIHLYEKQSRSAFHVAADEDVKQEEKTSIEAV